jgi:hypothetical protein
MRTTLDVDPDVLLAAKDLARRSHKTAGQVISELARQALQQPATFQANAELEEVCGFKPFPRRGAVVSNTLINQLRDQDID